MRNKVFVSLKDSNLGVFDYHCCQTTNKVYIYSEYDPIELHASFNTEKLLDDRQIFKEIKECLRFLQHFIVLERVKKEIHQERSCMPIICDPHNNLVNKMK